MNHGYKRIVLIAVIFPGIFSSCGRDEGVWTPNPKEFTINVVSRSTVEIEYTGSYTVLDAGGDSSTVNVTGKTPQVYVAQGDMISCTFKKKDIMGTLQVEVSCTSCSKTQMTTAHYGSVSVALKRKQTAAEN